MGIMRGGIIGTQAASASGSAIITSTAGVQSLESLSGIIDLDSPNQSITISTSGQVIQLNAIFTPGSGQYVNGINQRLIELSGLTNGLPRTQTSINGLSGTVNLTSPGNSVNISVNGQSIELTIPTSGAPSGASYLLRQYNDNGHLPTARVLSATSGIKLVDHGARSTSGLIISLDADNSPTVGQVPVWNGSSITWQNQTGSGSGGTTIVNGTNTGIELDFTPASGTTFVMYHGFSSTSFVWSLWDRSVSPLATVQPETVFPSGLNHVGITIQVPFSGKLALTPTNPTTTSPVQARKSVARFSPLSGIQFVVYHGLGTEDFSFTMWDTTTSDFFTIPDNIRPSGSNHAIVDLDVPTYGKLVLVG
jgi:hypothetical protein